MSTRIFSDRPIEALTGDELGFDEHAEALANLMFQVDLKDLPFCVGIYGEWGSGKSTLMNFVREKLLERHTKTVWVNPWKYDRKETLWAALILEILAQIEEDTSPAGRVQKATSKAKALVKQILPTVARQTIVSGISALGTQSGLDPLATQGAATMASTVLDGIDSLAPLEHDRLRDFVNNFEKEFKAAVVAHVGRNKRLVVFLDDLDRCTPDGAVMVLDAIKLFLDKSPCIFVIGADQLVIQQAVAHRYGTGYANRDYLEKIIQVHFRMPRARTQVIDALWDLVKNGPGHNDTVKTLASAVIPPNLRQWKRFLNAFALATEVAHAKNIPLGPGQDLARAFTVLLAMRFPGLFDLFVQNPPSASKFLDMLAGGSQNWTNERLSSTDLADFIPFTSDGALIQFLRSSSDILRRRLPDGTTVDATRIQEAISCVPL